MPTPEPGSVSASASSCANESSSASELAIGAGRGVRSDEAAGLAGSAREAFRLLPAFSIVADFARSRRSAVASAETVSSWVSCSFVSCSVTTANFFRCAVAATDASVICFSSRLHRLNASSFS